MTDDSDVKTYLSSGRESSEDEEWQRHSMSASDAGLVSLHVREDFVLLFRMCRISRLYL